jgi:predicted permease
VLVVIQVALALVLLIGSGLMLRTFQALRNVQPGFTSPETVQTLRISIPQAQVGDPERTMRMESEILDKLAAIPGVTSVAAANSITMDGADNNDPIFVEDRPAAEGKLPPIRRFKHISPGYFRTLGNRLRAGRDFTWTDIWDKRPYVLMSENLAREFWGDPAAAIGKRVRENPKGDWREVIGVVAEERDNGVDKKAPAIVYWPLMIKNFWIAPLSIQRSPAIAIRSSRAGSAAFIKEIQRAVWSVNSNIPLANVRTLQEIYDRSMARTSFTLVMLGIASAMAVLLGIVGIYGVISYSVSQRTREIGIRMALGAPGAKVTRMFVRDGLVLASLGLAAGLVAAAYVTQTMATLLFEVRPIDPATYVGVSGMLLIAALAATWIPARRATMVQPVDALRSE